MRLKITHTTHYAYDAPVIYGLQQVRLTPVSSPHQTVLNWQTQIEGGAEELSFSDQYQNHTLLVRTAPDSSDLKVIASGEVETQAMGGIFGMVYGAAPLWHFTKNTPRTMAGPGIRQLAQKIDLQKNVLDSLHDLSKSILSAVPYGAVETFADTPAEEALALQGGVCQDHAQIFVSAVRHVGIPARYVSGYLMMNDRVEQDASHAWAEAHVDGLGWVGFDVSNGISPDERYVRIAIGLDSIDAAPISGIRMGAAAESMIVSLQVQQ